MPTVPRIQPQISERALSTTRVPTEGPGIEAFGGGQKIAQAIGGIGDIAKDAYVDAAKAQVLKADTEATNAVNDLLNNPEYGALNLKGEQAFKAPEDVTSAYEENIRKIREGISNPLARAQFDKIALEKRSSVLNTVNKHVGNEIEQYNIQLADANLKAKSSFAIQNYMNPEIVNQSISEGLDVLEGSPAFRGLPQQAKELKKLEYASGVHSAIIDRMIDNGQDLAAQSYFDANKGSIVGKDLASIEKSLEASSSAAFAQREADKILAQTGSYRQALQMAKSIAGDDPKKRKALDDQITRQLNLRKQAEREDQENTSQYIGDLLDRNGGDLNDPRIQRMMTGMTINEKENINKYAMSISSGKNIQTDRDYYTDLRELAANNPNAFKNLNLNSAEVKNKLSRADWDKMFNIQQSVRKGKGTKELNNLRDDSQVAATFIAKMKINERSKEGKAKAADFKNKFYTALERFQDENGRRPKDSEMQQIANQLSIEVITEKGLFFDTKKRTFELADTEQIVEFANPEDKKRIMDTASNRPKKVVQKGVTFILNEATGKYERQ